MRAKALFTMVVGLVTVLAILHAAAELQRGNGEPLANLFMKTILVGAFGVLLGNVLYRLARSAGDA